MAAFSIADVHPATERQNVPVQPSLKALQKKNLASNDLIIWSRSKTGLPSKTSQ
jgi:hypothetical protein